LVDIEISRQSWDAIPCGCGRSARHIGELLRRVARGEDVDLVHAADNHVWSSPVLYSPAPAAAEVALAALADDLPQQTREQQLEPDRERLRQVQFALSETLPWDLRRGALNDPFGDEPHVGELGET
jgi:hypothetical protein